MINPNNEPVVADILKLIDQWESYVAHHGLSRDVFNALVKRIKPEDEYLCPECKMPTRGVSRGCGMCAQRKPAMYSAAYGRY